MRCVAVWLRIVSRRRSSSTAAFAGARRRSTPSTTFALITIGRNRAAIAHLAPTLRIERRLVENELDVAAFLRDLDALAVQDERRDRGVGRQVGVAAELGPDALGLLEHRVKLAEPHRVLRELRARPAAAPLRFELIAIPAFVDRHACA